ncbi:FecCD family ABC transporter permease [Taklimakanibacter lacteus]|uniref:FecCD family ABC transporter permease n=1 Tax=Taklimakanibacter lacteus TaxID=2268456 RepID=UPI000E663528
MESDAAPPARLAGDRSARAKLALILLAVLLAATALVSIMTGPVPLSIATVLDAIFAPENADLRDQAIVWSVRLPRTILAILVGGALAFAGAMMQGLFRNPLADPGIIGVSAGATFAAIAAIVLGEALLGAAALIYVLPIGAFVGGLLATITLYLIATRRGRTSVATMLLGGIAIAAMMMAASGVLIFKSNDQQLRELTFWSLGSLGGASWPKIFATTPFILFALLVGGSVASGFNALALGEAEARHLGIPVQVLKRIAIISVALLTGTAVAVSGSIGFIGIVVPHLLRLAIGPDHRYLLPASIFLGAVLLTGADMVSRTIVAPAELPIGIVTAMLGAPFFLWILLRNRNLVDL